MNFKKHEVVFNANKLYHENYVHIGKGLYKCGCGIIFEGKHRDTECPRCSLTNTAIKILEDLSKYAADNALEVGLKDILQTLADGLYEYDLYCEEDFPEFNRVLERVSFEL
nr:hypothetical protein 1 [bacterium]